MATTRNKKAAVIRAAKKGKVIKAASKGKANTGEDDLSVLHPDRKVTIAGRTIVMREYGFIEGLKLMPLLDPVIAEIRAVLEREEPIPGSEQIPAWLGNHADALVQLMAAAADVDADWIESLTLSDGHELIWWWWVTNGPFCMRSASQRIVASRAAKVALRAGQTSTPPSSAPATDQPTT